MNIPQVFADPSLQAWAEQAIKNYLETSGDIDPAQAPAMAPSVAPKQLTDALTTAHDELNADPRWADLADRIRNQSYREVVATMTDYAASDTMGKLRDALRQAITWYENSPLPSPDNIGHGEIITALKETPQTAIQQIAFNVEVDPFTVTIFVGVSSPIEYTDLSSDVVVYLGVAGGLGLGESVDLIHYVGATPLSPNDVPGHSIGGEVVVGVGDGLGGVTNYAGAVSFNCTTNAQRHFPDVYVEQWALMSGNFIGEALAVGVSVAFSVSIYSNSVPDIVLPLGTYFTVLHAVVCYQKMDKYSDKDEIYIEIQMDGQDPQIQYPYYGSHYSIEELNKHSDDDQDDGWPLLYSNANAVWYVGTPLTFNSYAYVTLYQGSQNRLGSMKITPSMIPGNGQANKNYILDIPDDSITNDIDYVFALTPPE